MPTITQLSNELSPRGRAALAKLLEQSRLFAWLEQNAAFVESATFCSSHAKRRLCR